MNVTIYPVNMYISQVAKNNKCAKMDTSIEIVMIVVKYVLNLYQDGAKLFLPFLLYLSPFLVWPEQPEMVIS